MREAIADEISRIRRAYARRGEDRLERRYTLQESGNVLRIEETQRLMQFAIAEFVGRGLSGRTILEVGCGTGYWLREFIQWGASPEKLTGIDLLPERIEIARRLCTAGVRLRCGDASALPFKSGEFDLVAQITMFTSILDESMKAAAAGEITRVLKSGGAVLWYDYFVNNPWNPDVRGIPKHEIRSLFPGFTVKLKRATLAPPLGRAIAKASPFLYQAASAAKLLCTHYTGLLIKP